MKDLFTPLYLNKKDKDGRRHRGIVYNRKQIEKRMGKFIMPFFKSEPPFMDYTGGFGYLGVLLYDTEIDRIQCHFCGKWYKSLNAHIKVHQISANEYKDKTGLFRSSPLASQGSLSKWKKEGIKYKKLMLGNIKKNIGKKIGNLTTNIRGLGARTIQRQNNHGTCDLQLFTKLQEEFKKYGDYTISDRNPKLYSALSYRFGSIKKALEYYNVF